MQNNYWNEIWKIVEFSDNIRENQHYKVSSSGRIRSFNIDKVKGRVLKMGKIEGYKVIGVKQINNKSTIKYVHLLVAKAFLKKNEDHYFIIHLDYDKTNNRADNLKWVSKEEFGKHHIKNPNKKYGNAKLNEDKVKLIKKQINNPNRKTKLKLIARRFGISEMQLYRIKTGENWSHVTID